MEPVFEPERDGYFATFRGSLSIDQLEQVRLQAAETFGDRSLRWAVLDMVDAYVDPATSLDQEARHLESVHFVAERVIDAATPELRMAVVANDEVTMTLLRLTTAAVGLAASEPGAPARALAHFDDVEDAARWARAES